MDDKDIKIFKKAIDKYYDLKDEEKLASILSQLHFSDIYDHIHEWKMGKIIDFLEYIDPKTSSNLFLRFEDSSREILLEKINTKVLTKIFDELYIDEIIDSFNDIGETTIKKSLLLLDETKRKKIDNILKYHKNEVGFNINVDYISIKDNLTIAQAKKNIKDQVNIKDLEIVGNIYIVNNKGILLGYITADILLSKPDTSKINQFIQKIEALHLHDNITMADDIITEYDVTSVPVIDNTKKLVGVIFIDDVLKRFEEINESLLGASAIVPSKKKYSETTVRELYKNRTPWIISLLFIGTLTQLIITLFQIIWVNNGVFNSSVGSSATISAVVSLALATSLSVSSSVNDAAGNSGSQVSATIIRSIAVGEIGDYEYKDVFFKEMKVAILIGFTAAFASFVRLFFVWGIMGFLDSETISSFAPDGKSNGWVWGWLVTIGVISSATFFISVIIGNALGVFLPIFTEKTKTDGAIISGPVQTTLIDIITFTIYLSFTTAIFIPLNNIGIFDLESTKSSFSSLLIYI